jgi:hypothetical protein
LPNATDGGAGSGRTCGSGGDADCPAGEFCDFNNNRCGADDSLGTCTTRPTACDDNLDPVCACDGKTYGNQCDAAAAGADVNAFGSCEVPAGKFACGFRQCEIQSQFCSHFGNDIAGEPDGFGCEVLPACPSQLPTCQCLVDAGVPCADIICEGDGATGLTVTCPGG